MIPPERKAHPTILLRLVCGESPGRPPPKRQSRVRRIGHTRRYEPLASGLRATTALIVLRNKAFKSLLAAARPLHPTRGALNPKPIDADYHAIQFAMQGVFHELGIAA